MRRAGPTSFIKTAWPRRVRESLYWLELMAASSLVQRSQLEPLIQETKELIAIVTAIIVKCKRNGTKNLAPEAHG